MKATPRNTAIQFALGLFCWGVLTAGRNAERFFGGEFEVLSPFRHVGLALIAVGLATVLYFVLRRTSSQAPESFDFPVPLLPAPHEADLPLLPDRSQHSLRLLPEPATSQSTGIDWSMPPGMQITEEELQSYIELLREVEKLLLPGTRLNLNAWSENGTLGPYQSLLRWHRQAFPNEYQPAPHPGRAPRSRHLRLIEDDS